MRESVIERDLVTKANAKVQAEGIYDSSTSTQILSSSIRTGNTERFFERETIPSAFPTTGGHGVHSLTSPVHRSKAL